MSDQPQRTDLAPFVREAVMEWARRSAAGELDDLTWVELNPDPRTEPYEVRRTRRGSIRFRQTRYGRQLPPSFLRDIARAEVGGGATMLQALTLAYAVPEWMVQARALLWTELTPVPSLLANLVEAYGISGEVHRGDSGRLVRLRARLPAWHKRRGDVGEALRMLVEAVHQAPEEHLSGLTPADGAAAPSGRALPAPDDLAQPEPLPDLGRMRAITGPTAEPALEPIDDAEPPPAARVADAAASDAEEPAAAAEARAKDALDDEVERTDPGMDDTVAPPTEDATEEVPPLGPVAEAMALAEALDDDEDLDKETPLGEEAALDEEAPLAPRDDDAGEVVASSALAATPPPHPLRDEVLACRSLGWWVRRRVAAAPAPDFRIANGYARFQPAAQPAFRLVREDVRVGWTPGRPLSPLAPRLLPLWACYRVVAEEPEQT